MLTHEIKSNDFRRAFTESQNRYIAYFLQSTKSSLALENREIDTEIPNLQNAFYLAVTSNKTEIIRDFWDAMSEYFWNMGYWRIFLDWGENTLKALNEIGTDPINAGELLNSLGWLRMEWGDYSIAEDIFNRARELLYRGNDPKGIGRVERYLGVLAYRKDDFDSAARQFDIAENIALTNGFELSLSEIYNLKGSLHKKLGNFEAAREYYNKSKEIIERIGDDWQLTAIMRNLYNLDILLGNLETAKLGFEQTINLCLKTVRKDMLYSCQLKLAGVEKQLGNFERAKELALAARDGFNSLDMKIGIERANQLLASLINKNAD